jgi:hypothetical protein
VELTSKLEIKAMQSCRPEELVEKNKKAMKLGFWRSRRQKEGLVVLIVRYLDYKPVGKYL